MKKRNFLLGVLATAYVIDRISKSVKRKEVESKDNEVTDQELEELDNWAKTKKEDSSTANKTFFIFPPSIIIRFARIKTAILLCPEMECNNTPLFFLHHIFRKRSELPLFQGCHHKFIKFRITRS